MKEIFIALLVFAVVGGGIALGLRYREGQKETSDSRPSIANFSPENLPENVVKEEDNKKDDSEKETEEGSASVKSDAPATVAIKVLNGGAAGGSAGKMTTYLKQNGYAKAEAGNADGSNIGIVIYYSALMADEVKALQLLLLKEYKGVTAKPVEDAKIPEAKTAPIVVVLGA